MYVLTSVFLHYIFCHNYKFCIESMSKTPTSSITAQTRNVNFIPKELPTTKDTNGISRTVHMHLVNLEKLLKDWVRLQGKGTSICKSIANLKCSESNDGSNALKTLTETLVECLSGFQHIVEGVDTIEKQLDALNRLHNRDEPVISTWSILQILDSVSDINRVLNNEYQLKSRVTENIAHCEDENVMEVFVSAWEFCVSLDIASTSYLFAEVGLQGIIS